LHCLTLFVPWQNIPHCRPNLAFASLLSNKWDTILW